MPISGLAILKLADRRDIATGPRQPAFQEARLVKPTRCSSYISHMSFDDALRHAAVRSGIQQDYWDIFGHQHWTSQETNKAILTALGYDCSSEDSLHASIDKKENKEKARLLPPVLVVGETGPLRIPLKRDGNADGFNGGIDLEIDYRGNTRRVAPLSHRPPHCPRRYGP